MCGKSIYRGTFNTWEKKFLKAAFQELQIFNMWRKAERLLTYGKLIDLIRHHLTMLLNILVAVVISFL